MADNHFSYSSVTVCRNGQQLDPDKMTDADWCDPFVAVVPWPTLYPERKRRCSYCKSYNEKRSHCASCGAPL